MYASSRLGYFFSQAAKEDMRRAEVPLDKVPPELLGRSKPPPIKKQDISEDETIDQSAVISLQMEWLPNIQPPLTNVHQRSFGPRRSLGIAQSAGHNYRRPLT